MSSREHRASEALAEEGATPPQARMMLMVGVEGDKFNPHRWLPDCGLQGCVPADGGHNALVNAGFEHGLAKISTEAEFERGMQEVHTRVRPHGMKTLESEAWVMYCMARAALRSFGIPEGKG